MDIRFAIVGSEKLLNNRISGGPTVQSRDDTPTPTGEIYT